MDKEAVALAYGGGELSDSFEEGLALNVAHGAADFHQRHVNALLVHGDDVHDLAGDVGDDLHGAAVVIAVTLAGNHVVVDLAGGGVAALVEAFVDKSLVVTEIKVGFRAVVGDEDFAVLDGVHRAGIHIEVRIQLLHGDLHASRFEKSAERCRGDSFAETRNHAACNKDVFRRHQKIAPPFFTSFEYIKTIT